MNDLIRRLRDATEGSAELDIALVHYAYEQQIPMDPFYPGPINYDPELWQIRHGWSPSTSIDAAMTLKPKGWRVIIETGENYTSAQFVKGYGSQKRHQPCFEVPYDNPALALCIAALSAKDTL
jgi:hypothetical protein